MVKVSDLSYQYPGRPPMVFTDFSVAAGHALLISGESGCGKTTLLHLLAGLLPSQGGTVTIDGVVLHDLSPAQLDQFRGQHIGLVYQKPYFIESLSISDNLLLSPFAGAKSRANAIVKQLDISDILHHYPSQTSLGEQQRATIARAVMNAPKLLLAAEPTSALDNQNCSYVMILLFEESITNDAALVIVSHDDRLREEIEDRIELAPRP